jgi:hypothetical protein
MACTGDCSCCNGDCEKYQDYIFDESGFIIGRASPSITEYHSTDFSDGGNIHYKYAEDKILSELKEHLDKTYSEHYATDDKGIECFDAWIALGDSTPTFRNTALKYLWRYGKKNGNNKKDLMKAMHYIFMCLYNDHYKDGK